MHEEVFNFGPDQNLFGILTTPDEDVKVAGAPIVLILNAGIVHRIGPFRLHVNIARQLAQAGFSTLRLDLSGLGDSVPRTGRLKSEDRAKMDVSDAMDELNKVVGCETFAVLGLCSGAFNAHQITVQDRRIVGAVFLDGIVFRTLGFHCRNSLRYLRPRFWRNAIKRRWKQKGTVEADAAGNKLAESEFFGGELSQGQVSNELRNLLERGVQMLFIYTDGYDDICGRAQFREMYGLCPDGGRLQVEYYPKAEHTFRIVENRKVACDRVTQWFTERFAAAHSRSRSVPFTSAVAHS